MCPGGEEPPNSDLEQGDKTCAELAALAKMLTPDHETCGAIQASAGPCGCPGVEMCTPVQILQSPSSD